MISDQEIVHHLTARGVPCLSEPNKGVVIYDGRFSRGKPRLSKSEFEDDLPPSPSSVSIKLPKLTIGGYDLLVLPDYLYEKPDPHILVLQSSESKSLRLARIEGVDSAELCGQMAEIILQMFPWNFPR
jgi:hypothetical protein